MLFALSSFVTCSQTKDEIVRWEEGKKWQAKMEKVKNSLKEKERENDSLSKQLSTLKDLYARSVCTSCQTVSKVLFVLALGAHDLQLKDAVGNLEHLASNDRVRD